MSRTTLRTRTKILTATWELLESQHGKNVRMSDIAKHANVSRQSIYLHFKTRTELMIATVQYGDIVLNHASQIRHWAETVGGVAKLDAWIEAWGNYLPQVYGVAKALMLARESDEAAEATWQDRMAEVRSACKVTIDALVADGMLSADFTPEVATELLKTINSVESWEYFTQECGWSKEQHTSYMQLTARKLFVKKMS